MRAKARFAVVLLAAVASVALTACGGDALSVLTTAATDASATSVSADKPGFNPFNDAPESSFGGREVIANPTVAEVMLTGDLPEMSWGRADAPVTLIKYGSLTCPHCKRFQAEAYPLLKREYIDTGKVRFIIREFPIGKTSGSATVALRCATPEKYLDLYGKFLSQQPAWVSQEVRPEAIFKIAAQVGVTDAQFSACMKNQTLISQLNWVKERGRKLGVIGTPNFFLNGRLIKSAVGISELRALIDPLVASGGAAVVKAN
jgi:protein-disulfide isomerase